MSDFSNLRRDPFTAAYSYRVMDTEYHTIAEFSELPGRYGFQLKDKPESGSVVIEEDVTGGDEFVQVTTAPLAGQCRIDFTAGYVFFNVADNGKDCVCDYSGGGSNMSKESITLIAGNDSRIAALEPDVQATGGLLDRMDAVESDISTGWIAGDALTYVSADAPTYVASVASDVTTKYCPGMRIKLTDAAAVKYFIITAVGAYAGGVTPLTLYGGTDYTLAGGAITLPYYSPMKAPWGFPLDPTKWCVELQDSSTRNTTSGTYVNVGSLVLNIPIGSWEIYAKGILSNGGTSYTFFTLSTGSTSESDPDFTIAHYSTPIMAHFVMKKINVASKTPYYVNLCSQDGNTASLRGDVVPTIVHAVCAYL
jgi:hypothetical protein